MVEVKNGYLYMLSEDSGKITCEECELYFFGGSYENRYLMINVPGRNNWRFNYIPNVDKNEYITFWFGYQSEGYIMFWCLERDDERAKCIFVNRQDERVSMAQKNLSTAKYHLFKLQTGGAIIDWGKEKLSDG